MTKQTELEEETTELDEALLDELAEKLETTVNKICNNHAEKDPRFELLVTFGLFAAKVGVDSGYAKEEFIVLMAEMFSDIEQQEEENDNEVNEMDKSKFN